MDLDKATLISNQRKKGQRAALKDLEDKRVQETMCERSLDEKM